MDGLVMKIEGAKGVNRRKRRCDEINNLHDDLEVLLILENFEFLKSDHY